MLRSWYLALIIMPLYPPEQLSEINVVSGLLKPEAAAVVDVHGKLSREPLGGRSSLVSFQNIEIIELIPCTTLLQGWTSSFHWSSRISVSWLQPANNLFGIKFIQTQHVPHLEPLPGETAPDEVHEDISQALHVVPSALFNAKVGIDRGISINK